MAKWLPGEDFIIDLLKLGKARKPLPGDNAADIENAISGGLFDESKLMEGIPEDMGGGPLDMNFIDEMGLGAYNDPTFEEGQGLSMSNIMAMLDSGDWPSASSGVNDAIKRLAGERLAQLDNGGGRLFDPEGSEGGPTVSALASAINLSDGEAMHNLLKELGNRLLGGNPLEQSGLGVGAARDAMNMGNEKEIAQMAAAYSALMGAEGHPVGSMKGNFLDVLGAPEVQDTEGLIAQLVDAGVPIPYILKMIHGSMNLSPVQYDSGALARNYAAQGKELSTDDESFLQAMLGSRA